MPQKQLQRVELIPHHRAVENRAIELGQGIHMGALVKKIADDIQLFRRPPRRPEQRRTIASQLPRVHVLAPLDQNSTMRR